ncbi:MAG: substrate-binding domain-containing protein [Chloroflexi bacterium]|nr:substrate-binding domain-containing protein [Chloroflexota bacterium]
MVSSLKRVAAVIAVTAVVAAACSSAATPSPSASSAAGGSSATGIVALLLPEKQTARYEAADKPFFAAEFAKVCPNATLDYQNAGGDAPTQQQQAEAEIAKGAKVLVLDAQDGKSLGQVMTDAAAKGIKVISYDRLITAANSKPDYYISFDNEKVGELQGTALLAKLTADGKTNPKLVWINGSPQDNNATLFKQGAHKVLDGKVTIVKEDAMANWKPEEAQAIMEAAITQFGAAGYDGVYVANDGGAGGVYAAEQAAGIDPKTKPMTGQDAQLDAIQRIVAGQQYMTVYKAIQPEAAQAADLACQLLGGTVPTSTSTVNNGTIDVPSILLTPIAVTVDGSNGTTSVENSVVKDQFYGANTVSQICTSAFQAACTAAGVK